MYLCGFSKKNQSHSFQLKANRGCQTVYFHAKNPNLGTFVSALELKLLVCFIIICNILRPFGICYSPFVKFVVLRPIYPRLGMFYQEKSGNPDATQVLNFVGRKKPGKELFLT
jgi:hypothetical protein